MLSEWLSVIEIVDVKCKVSDNVLVLASELLLDLDVVGDVDKETD